MTDMRYQVEGAEGVVCSPWFTERPAKKDAIERARATGRRYSVARFDAERPEGYYEKIGEAVPNGKGDVRWVDEVKVA